MYFWDFFKEPSQDLFQRFLGSSIRIIWDFLDEFLMHFKDFFSKIPKEINEDVKKLFWRP